MKYQLVLQLPEDALDYDEAIKLENELIAKLEDHEVDGHDMGSGQLNYFVLTDDPKECFEHCLPVMGANLKKSLKAAYRDVGKDKYTILFPPALGEFKVT